MTLDDALAVIGDALTDRMVLDGLDLVNTAKDVLLEDEAWQPSEPLRWNDDDPR